MGSFGHLHRHPDRRGSGREPGRLREQDDVHHPVRISRRQDGKRTRARIYENDSVPPVYRIDAVEQPLAALPGLHVELMPEVIRSFQMETPITDRLAAPGNAQDRDAIQRLRAWEIMVVRLTRGWPPDGWYPGDYYRRDMTIRDALAEPAALPPVLQDDFAAGLAEVDRRFADLTDDDGGRALAAETGPLPADESHWWWRRVPHPLPWDAAPRGDH